MVINLITFASLLHKQASVRSSHEIILNELEKYFTVNFIDYQDINKLSPDDFSILFIATAEWNGWLSSISKLFPALPSSWQTVCRTRLPPPSKYLPGCAAGNEKRNPAWRTVRNYQTHFCTAQQFHGATRPLRNAYRRNRHSVELAHCQQRGLSACQTTLGSGIHRYRTGTRVRILQPNHG